MLITVYQLLIWLDILNTHWDLWSKSYKIRSLFDSLLEFSGSLSLCEVIYCSSFFTPVHEKHFYTAIFPLIIICPLIVSFILYIYMDIYLINFSTSEYDFNLYKLLKIWNCQVIWVCNLWLITKTVWIFPVCP